MIGISFVQVGNLAIRLTTMSLKFFLSLYLAKTISPSEFGLYGVLVGTVSYYLIFLGMEFYAFSTREIARSGYTKWGAVLVNHFLLIFVVYIFIFPLCWLPINYGVIPAAYAGVFLILLAVEHINQELYRVAIAMRFPVRASVALFVRQAIWIAPLVVTMEFDPLARNLDYVLLYWSIGSGCALVFSVFCIFQLRFFEGLDLKRSVDCSWMWVGIKVAAPLLLGSLAVRGFYVFDRYWIEAHWGLEVVAIYVLFIGVCNVILSVSDSLIFSVLYPELVMHGAMNREESYKRLVKKMFIQVTVVVCVMDLFLLGMIGPMLGWLGRAVYMDNMNIFYWILLSFNIWVLGLIPHYVLYSKSHDKFIWCSHLSGFFLFVALCATLKDFLGISTVAISFCCSFVFVLVWKMYGAIRI